MKWSRKVIYSKSRFFDSRRSLRITLKIITTPLCHTDRAESERSVSKTNNELQCHVERRDFSLAVETSTTFRFFGFRWSLRMTLKIITTPLCHTDRAESERSVSKTSKELQCHVERRDFSLEVETSTTFRFFNSRRSLRITIKKNKNFSTKKGIRNF